MGLIKIVNKSKNKVIATLSDNPNEIVIIDEETGKKYTLQEWRDKEAGK